jgi:hypothetical protein
MAFSRALAPERVPGHDALTAAMVGIGMGFATSAAAEPNIEDTLFFASAEAMEGNDGQRRSAHEARLDPRFRACLRLVDRARQLAGQGPPLRPPRYSLPGTAS